MNFWFASSAFADTIAAAADTAQTAKAAAQVAVEQSSPEAGSQLIPDWVGLLGVLIALIAAGIAWRSVRQQRELTHKQLEQQK